MKNVVVIPKLEFLFLDGVYIGALVCSNKKNDLPIIFTDAQGGILGTNRVVC